MSSYPYCNTTLYVCIAEMKKEHKMAVMADNKNNLSLLLSRDYIKLLN